MSNNKIVKLGNLDSSQLVESPKIKHALPLDIYLLPYTLKEFQDTYQIPDRDLKQAQKLKINHIAETYLNAVQLLFSALVMTHESIPYFKKRIPSQTSQAAQSANLIPEHCETLDQVFGGNQPTKINKYSNRCSYSDLGDIFDLGKSFFRGEPPFSRKRENDIIFSGWDLFFVVGRRGNLCQGWGCG